MQSRQTASVTPQIALLPTRENEQPRTALARWLLGGGRLDRLQGHSKQWTGNFFAVADSSIYMLDHIRATTFDIEKALQQAGVYTPEDTITIRNIGAMGVRPTQIMMYHTAPGEVWWDGLMRVSQEYVEYVETSVTPRLGAEKTKQWVSWIPEYEKRIRDLQSGSQSK